MLKLRFGLFLLSFYPMGSFVLRVDWADSDKTMETANKTHHDVLI